MKQLTERDLARLLHRAHALGYDQRQRHQEKEDAGIPINLVDEAAEERVQIQELIDEV